MTIIAAIVGGLLILLVAQDAFETIVLPRRVARRIRLTRFFFVTTWGGWKTFARMIKPGARRETALSYYGPLSLLALIVLWAILFVFGFGTLMWGLEFPLNASDKPVNFSTYLYLSGTTFFTLGLGDISPVLGIGRLLIVVEVACGFGFLALVISYVPVLYQAFSHREERISLLDARAGSPATAFEFLRRNYSDRPGSELGTLLREWEVWCANILESHLSYPVLAYYRSQHDKQSWVEALTVILDTSALILSGIKQAPVEPARFAFAMARHAVIDLAQVFGSTSTPCPDRLPPEEFSQLQVRLAASGIYFKEGIAVEQKLAELREAYEPFVNILADNLMVSLPPWLPTKDALDDWQTSSWDNTGLSTRETLLEVMQTK